MLNWIWLGLILVAVVYAAFTGNMGAVSLSVFDGAKGAVNVVIGLLGPMVLFLGLMRVAIDGGLMRAIARGISPLLRRLFPDVPPDHPAMGAMVMNFASNILGLGNAATPFGLKAMQELSRLNPLPGVATNSMILFLAINTSAITLMAPTGTMAVRSATGSVNPGAIWIPTLIATTCSTLAAIGAFYLFGRLRRFEPRPLPRAAPPAPAEALGPAAEEIPSPEPRLEPGAGSGLGRWLLIAGCVAALIAGLSVEVARLRDTMPAGGVLKEVAKTWPIPLLVLLLLLIGVRGRVRVYESMVEGAKEGLTVAVRIVPYLVAILVAVAMFHASGALDRLIGWVDPATRLIGVPAEVLPMALLRPLSGSGALGVMTEILQTHGPDSFAGLLASTLMGSTETTFYVLTLYCGAAGVKDVRHALAACLTGDVAGFLGATAACHLFFG